jgi:hypothetical protein
MRTPARTLLLAALVWPAALADDGACKVLMLEEQNDREDYALALDLADDELVAAQEIYELLEALWKNDAVQRLSYVTGKHDRDAAKLAKERDALLLERQDALIEQLRSACGSSSSDDGDGFGRAHEKYVKADCGRLSKEAALAQVDLEYEKEVLASFRDLRENDVATAQDVILSERDVAMARKRLESSRTRADACRTRLAALGR